MGYDLHITRRDAWADAGRDIPLEEWLTLVGADPELRLRTDHGTGDVMWTGGPDRRERWLRWDDGNVSTKNPDEALVAKMVAIAERLQAHVQGDDGEVYPLDPDMIRAPRPGSFHHRLLGWLDRVRRRPTSPGPALPFGVGARVRDVWGQEAVVLAIDASAEHGLGAIRVRYEDGRELTYSASAHPFLDA
jgi:hypothetical protein